MQATKHSEPAVRAREDACADETWNDEEERSIMHEALAPLVNVLVSLHRTQVAEHFCTAGCGCLVGCTIADAWHVPAAASRLARACVAAAAAKPALGHEAPAAPFASLTRNWRCQPVPNPVVPKLYPPASFFCDGHLFGSIASRHSPPFFRHSSRGEVSSSRKNSWISKEGDRVRPTSRQSNLKISAIKRTEAQPARPADGGPASLQRHSSPLWAQWGLWKW